MYPLGPLPVNTHVVHHFAMKRTDPQYKLRIPEDLKSQIEGAAKANNRSMNAEIISRLEASFSGVVLSKPSDVTPYLGNFLALLEESGMFEITPKGREYIKSKKGKEE